MPSWSTAWMEAWIGYEDMDEGVLDRLSEVPEGLDGD